MEIIYNILDSYRGIYDKVIGSGAYGVLWVLALLYLFIRKKGDKEKFVIPFLVSFIVAANPITVMVISKIASAGEASRLLWCLLGGFFVAFVVVDIVYSVDVKKKKIAGIILICTLILSGKFIINTDDFSEPFNRYNLKPETIWVAEHLSNYYTGEKIICSDNIVTELHQYDATIPMYYGRWEIFLYIENYLDNYDIDGLKNYLNVAQQDGVTRIVLEANDDYTYQMNACGWFVSDGVDNYDIYSYAGDSWIMSNYVDDSGNQGMFYTMYNPASGNLIAVDSGWKQNEDQVRKIINAYGGHVNAWFLTHYDNDHVDAFNAICSDRNGIEIDKVYVTPLDENDYMSQLRDWDTPESYIRFKQVTSDMNVISLNRGDKLNICGLNVNVYNAYDDIVREKNMDLPNNASLVFKVSGQEDSILFCGDCHDLGSEIVSLYGNELESEYVQVGHHGHNSFAIDFYDVVKPRVAIFDAPAWEMEGEQYNASNLAEQLLIRGVFTVDYRSGMHNFRFR